MAALSALIVMPNIPGTDVHFLVPYAIEAPGPTFNTLGSVEGKEVVEIEGAPTDPTNGKLNMTTVAVSSGITLPQAIAEGLWSSNTMVPIEQIFPQDVSPEEQREVNSADFAASEASATAAAMHYLDRPLAVEVAQVVPDGPAADQLEQGDVILAIDNQQVSSPKQVKEAVADQKPGQKLALKVKRKDQEQTIDVTLGSHPNNDAAFLGIVMAQVPADGMKVTYNLKDIGGPSAGLIFSLAVVDKLDPADITGGAFVAGTGTINEEGKVGPIGGIRHKIEASKDAGAEVFLAPKGNCAEIDAKTSEGIEVAAVGSLEEAIDALSAHQRGEAMPTCG
ncbi:Lon protease 2 [Corynebacterium pseudopelargi]|uniref:endopeptidase La n=2 Tax=Corynebacterium pseudopelargi TaxID=2080757 RepID=A0A3G6IVI3_9CORY|nr:Lon protease 2 [Corynebacterium pseudopelargi]